MPVVVLSCGARTWTGSINQINVDRSGRVLLEVILVSTHLLGS